MSDRGLRPPVPPERRGARCARRPSCSAEPGSLRSRFGGVASRPQPVATAEGGRKTPMDKAVERWRSDRMQQDITLARWGHFGVPVLVFPTAGGDAEEVERHHMVGHLAPLVEDGRIKVYFCDSVAGRAMTRDGA